MIALLASLLLLAYVLVPGAIFRLIFSGFLPLRAFDRTRAQEFAYAFSVCVLPFLLALCLVWHVPVIRSYPFQFADTWSLRTADYRTILLYSYSDRFIDSKDELWTAFGRAGRRHGKLITWYYLLVGFEAALLGWAAKSFGRWQRHRQGSPLLDWATRKLLLPNVSEWHVLLTDFLYAGATIEADVLTGEDRLYGGTILDFTIDREGGLTGVYLENAERFDRVGYLKVKGSGSPDVSAFWKKIPGEKLFIMADKIYTLNIRPRTSDEKLESLARELDAAAVVTVEPAAEPDDARPAAAAR